MSRRRLFITLSLAVSFLSGLIMLTGCGDSSTGNDPTYFTLAASAGIGGTVTVTPSTSSKLELGTEVTVTATPAVGYYFSTWRAVSGTLPPGVIATSPVITFTIQSNVNITADFLPITYAITFDANGGTVTPASDTTGIGGVLASLPTPARAGYTFDDWFKTITGDTAVTASTVFTANDTVYAKWTLDIYAVKFDAGGGVITPASDTVGLTGIGWTLASLPTPTNVGYTFDGWFTSLTSDTAVTVGTVFTANDTVYAKWTLDIYAVKFDAVGGVITPASDTVGLTGIGWTLAAVPTPTRLGYTFDGWFTSPTSDTAVTASTVFAANDTVYAQWTIDTCSIDYDLDGGTLTTDNPTTYDITTAEFTLTNPTKTGYTFAGWTEVNSETPQPTVTIPIGSTGNKNYTANYTPIPYTITYNLDNGTVATDNPTSYNITSAITLNNPTRAGYTFAGWTGSNGETPQTAVSIPIGSTEDKTYTANWTLAIYTIAYTLGGGTVAIANPEDYNITSDAITLNNPIRADYIFIGWTGSNGETPQTAVTIPTGSVDDRVYTANWRLIRYTITFNATNGETATKDSTDVGYVLASLPEPTRTGYNFVGWFNAETEGEQVTTSTVFSADATIYAQWSLVTYNITYNLNNGINNPSNPASYTIESPAITLQEPTRNYHTFAGWYDNSTLAGNAATSIPTGSTGNKTYWAKWTPLPDGTPGPVLDYGDQEYKTVIIGAKMWMAENLNYETENSWCFANESTYCETYGRLYTWDAAMSACPVSDGWRLPSHDDWGALFTAANNNANNLRASHGWPDSYQDNLGFSALPGGMRSSNNFSYTTSGWWWSSTTDDGNNNAARPQIGPTGSYIGMNWQNKNDALSVRCVKD